MEEGGIELNQLNAITQSTGTSYFLGIGINQYESFPKLRNALRDVIDFRNLLVERYAFDIANTWLLTNQQANRAAIVDWLHYIFQKATIDDRVLLYYAGHGLLEGEVGYWLASDSRVGVYSSYIENSFVRERIRYSKARHVLLISDSCFSGSLLTRHLGNIRNRPYIDWNDLNSRYIFTSGKGIVEDGKPGQNSPFANSILETLRQNKEPILNIGLLADLVTKQVKWNYDQLPECTPLFQTGHDGGQFLFFLSDKLDSNIQNSYALNTTEVIEEISDFTIKSPKYKSARGEKPRPLLLQNGFVKHFIYVLGHTWKPLSRVPFFTDDDWESNNRKLPGLPIYYPWLTVSDFLEPYLVRLPFPIDTDKFLTYKYQQNSEFDKDFLLPLKGTFFTFFSISDLTNGNVLFEINSVAQGIKVVLKLPIEANSQPIQQFITFERIYSSSRVSNNIANGYIKPDELKNEGLIVEMSFTINIFPFIRSGIIKIPADYRVQFIESGFDHTNQYELLFFQEKKREPLVPNLVSTRTIRRQNTDGSSVYHVIKEEFDYCQVQIHPGPVEITIRALMIPIWPLYNRQTKHFNFSVDIGKTITHVMYQINSQPVKPLDIGFQKPHLATLVDPNCYNPALFELFLLFDLEFVPSVIGAGQPDNFPTRTALSEGEHVLFNRPTENLSDFNIPFFFARQPAGSNRITLNLQWDHNQDHIQRRRLLAFLEEIVYLIRTKVLIEGGSLDQTTIYWICPPSVKAGRDWWRNAWHSRFSQYFQTSTRLLIEVPKSIAPYNFYYQLGQLPINQHNPIVSLYLGSESTELTVFINNQPILISSFAFSINDIFVGKFYNSYLASHNGFVRRYIDKFQNIFEKNGCGTAADINGDFLPNAFSKDVLNFWSDFPYSWLNYEKKLISFKRLLVQDSEMSIVFVFYYSAILYHIARLIQQKGWGVPKALLISGKGAEIISLIANSSKDSDTNSANVLTQYLFEEIFKQKISNPQEFVIWTAFSAKMITCQGGLYQEPYKHQQETEQLRMVYTGIHNRPTQSLTYDDLQQVKVIEDIDEQIRSFVDFFFDLDQKVSFNTILGVPLESLLIARQLFTNADFKEWLTKATAAKKRQEFTFNYFETSSYSAFEDSPFFYPLLLGISQLIHRIVFKQEPFESTSN